MFRKLIAVIALFTVFFTGCKKSSTEAQGSNFVKATQLLTDSKKQCDLLKDQVSKIARPTLGSEENYQKVLEILKKIINADPAVNLLLSKFNELEATEAELDSYYFLTTKVICKPSYRLKFSNTLLKDLDKAQLSVDFKNTILTQVMKPILLPDPHNSTMVDTMINLNLLRRLEQLEMVKVADPLFETNLKKLMIEIRSSARASTAAHKAYAQRDYAGYYRLVKSENLKVNEYQAQVKALAKGFSY